jgi:type IV/VI secretion system ImpK/VasF family protein
MKNEQWEAIHSVLVTMESLFGLHGNVPEEEAEIKQLEQPSDDAALRDLVSIREKIRTELSGLKNKLAERLSERDCYLILFPLVAHFDEIVQTSRLDADQITWPPLQRELFRIDDAGEMFYETLNDILVKPQTLPLIYEVFYYCLNDGFRGRYNDNPMKINEYMEILRTKISHLVLLEPARVEPVKVDMNPHIPRAWRSPACYYAGAGFVIIALYFVLHTMAQTWSRILD